MKLKKVITNEKLYEKMEEAITLLCSVVKTTLGPKGNNAIINSSLRTPYITNDGVTIAQNIESEDKIINTILNIAKEASIKTNELVGDGTTTTLVLLEELFNKGIEYVKKGVSPIIIKKQLDNSLKYVIDSLKKMSCEPDNNKLYNIAKISSNDEEIGNIICKAYLKLDNKNGINIVETDKEKTEVVYYDGYMFDTNIASSYFFQNNSQINYGETMLLIVDDYLDEIESISEILNEIIEKDKNFVIFAKDYSEDFINNILSIYLDNQAKVVLLKNPMYGDNQLVINKDISFLSGALINKSDQINYKSIGKIKSIQIDKEKTIIGFEHNKQIDEEIILIEKELAKMDNEFDIDYYKKRLAMFKNGLVNILVGAPTKIECIEKKMRYEDALCSLDISKKGVLPGSGVALLKLERMLTNSDYGTIIMKNALSKPFKQILVNAGLEEDKIIARIEKDNYNVLYNVNNESFEDFDKTDVIDPLYVVIRSLSNAVSIAGMLLTTSSLIINENIDEINNEEL